MRSLPLLLFLLASPLAAQEVGGGAAAFLRGESAPQRIALGDAGVVTGEAGMTLFGGSAVLSRLEGPSAAVGVGTTPTGFTTMYAGVGLPVGNGGGVGLTVLSQSTGAMRAFDELEMELGTFEARDLAVSLRGGLTVGPGAIGATVRYLNGTTTAPQSAGYSGYALDLSGALDLGDGRFSLDLENIAGEIAGKDGGTRIVVPPRVAAAAAWLFPFEERRESPRNPATGVPDSKPLPPRTYLAAAASLSIDTDDSGPTLGVGAEWAPLAELPLQLRLGGTTTGDLAFGLTVALPVDLVRGNRVAATVRRDHTLGDLSYHLMVALDL